MKKITFLLLLGLFVLSLDEARAWQNKPATTCMNPSPHPFPRSYKNLFQELLNRSELQIQLKVDSAFAQLFYGDDLKQRVYYPVDPDMAYIEDILHHDVRTEGMSYGMMIAVQLDKKAEFDRLWKWAKTFMQHKDGPHKGYFAWHCSTDGMMIDNNAASDGEEWFATALFLAAARWGNGQGIFNYRVEAQSILDAMFDKTIDSDQPGVVTNMFNHKEKQVVFVPVGHIDHFTDPSYHLPHFYELWARWADKRNSFWQEAAWISRNFLKKACHPQTGLSPDYANYDGTPCDAPWGGDHHDFRYDAWRTAMNIAVDYSWFAADEWAVTQSNRLLDFFYSQGIDRYGHLYTLEGKVISADRSHGLAAMNAVACLAATHPHRREFVQALWNMPVPNGIYRYYDGLLYLLALLQVSGNFRIYDAEKIPLATLDDYVTSEKEHAAFILCEAGSAAPLHASAGDYPGVLRVLGHLQKDIRRVTGAQSQIMLDALPTAREIVVIGTLGKNKIIDQLVHDHKLDVENLEGKWETFLIQVVEQPLPGVDRALVIMGSDKRGTIFGMYDLAEKIGVSPWHFWADVPVPRRQNLYITSGRHSAGTPKIKYRGIFINDEAPALTGWAYEKYGGLNAKFYEHVFELILRLKGNFLWPAMWGRMFYVEDPLNPKLADEYGIVISTSHHEPLMRAHAEWAQFGKGPWNYSKNNEVLQEFWREGIHRMGANESVVTIGMRGDGDEPMSEEANIALLEEIVQDQRNLIAEVTQKPANQTPQVWALYKEVQEYYDKGMRVPEDVTLLLCDNNWGNLRKLPRPGDSPRAGGYGIYYHYDYVGGPRNYKWVNTNQIERIWEQMNLAYRSGVDRIWIVNVGDIKPMEFPISFFLDYAWDPEKWPASRLPEYTELWAERQFGSKQAVEIADILRTYTKFNSRRKPELLAPETYRLTAFREAETIVADYNQLAAQARQIYTTVSAEYQPAFYQLALHPAEACANLNELYVTVAKNHCYANQGRAETNQLAEAAKKLFDRDAAISHFYNHTLLNGKWNHMMDQTHIGYTYWQQPETNVMPDVKTITVPEAAEMGVAIEGSTAWWPNERKEAVLPEFDCFNRQKYYIEVFNRGRSPFLYRVKIGEKWLGVDQKKGQVETSTRLWVAVDWEKAPIGTQRVPIIISGPGKSRVIVHAPVRNQPLALKEQKDRFIESNGHVAMEAEHYQRAVHRDPVTWMKIPNLGRTLSAMTAAPLFPALEKFDDQSPRLEYEVYLYSKGQVTVKVHLSPTLNFFDNQGLRYGISFDDEPVQIVNLHEGKTFQDWEESVSNNITLGISQHLIAEPGNHVLKFWAMDPGVVLQRIVVETAEIPACYLGPPESYRQTMKAPLR